MDIDKLLEKSDFFIKAVDDIELENNAAIRSREQMMKSIEIIKEENKENSEAYDIATHAIEILQGLSDEAVAKAYKYLEGSINDALAKMFRNTTRMIQIHEFLRDDRHPQLEIELKVGNGITRSLKSDSGHGIAQIVSLLSILCLIVLTGGRRILCIDEVISGLSIEKRKIVTDILWCFTEIGFQFIVIEHGYIPKGAKVYHMELNGDVGRVADTYIATNGVYLDDKAYDECKTYGEVAGRMKELATNETGDVLTRAMTAYSEAVEGNSGTNVISI